MLYQKHAIPRRVRRLTPFSVLVVEAKIIEFCGGEDDIVFVILLLV
jgi:hypothetical protein